MTGRGIAQSYDITSPGFQAEHGIKGHNAANVTVRDIEVISALFNILTCQIMLRIIILKFV
jgi:hypothetical protein